MLATKRAVDAYIMDRIHDRVVQAAVMHPRYERLWREIARIYQAGGKRNGSDRKSVV